MGLCYMSLFKIRMKYNYHILHTQYRNIIEKRKTKKICFNLKINPSELLIYVFSVLFCFMNYVDIGHKKRGDINQPSYASSCD